MMSQELVSNVTTLVQHVLPMENTNVQLVKEIYLFMTDNVLNLAQMVGILKITSVLYAIIGVKLALEVAIRNVHLAIIPNTYKMENVRIIVTHIIMKTMLQILVTLVMKTVLNVQLILTRIVSNVTMENTLNMVNVKTNVMK
jgi:hypothetical protein